MYWNKWRQLKLAYSRIIYKESDNKMFVKCVSVKIYKQFEVLYDPYLVSFIDIIWHVRNL